MIAQNLRAAATALMLAAMAFFTAAAPAQSAGTAAAVAAKPVVVEVNEGRLIKLSNSASSVFIANPDIADVSVKSPRLVYVFGVQPGETTLYAVDRNDRMIASLKIQVEHNLSGLNSALKRVIPDGAVTATSIDEVHQGDNGPFRGELGDAYEGSIRTAGMVKWPGKIRPRRSNEMFAIHDFLPQDRPPIESTSLETVLNASALHRYDWIYQAESNLAMAESERASENYSLRQTMQAWLDSA